MGAAAPRTAGVLSILPSGQKTAGRQHYCCRQTGMPDRVTALLLHLQQTSVPLNVVLTQDLKDFLTGVVQSSQYIRQPEINLTGLPLQQEVRSPFDHRYCSHKRSFLVTALNHVLHYCYMQADETLQEPSSKRQRVEEGSLGS